VTDAAVEVVGQCGEVLLALPDGLGVAAQEVGDDLGAAVAELGRLDGDVASAVLLRERVVEHPHRALDLGAERHGRRSGARGDVASYDRRAKTPLREVVSSAILRFITSAKPERKLQY